MDVIVYLYPASCSYRLPATCTSRASAAPDRSVHGRFGCPGRPRARADMRTRWPCCLPWRAHAPAQQQGRARARRHVPLRAVPAASGGTRGTLAADAAQAGGRGGLTTAAGRGGRGATSSSCATRRGINALWCDAGGRLRRRVAWGCVRVRPTRPPAAGGRARDAGRGHAGPALRRRLMPLGAMRGRGRGCPPWLPPGRALTGTCQPLPVDDDAVLPLSFPYATSFRFLDVPIDPPCCCCCCYVPFR